MTFIISIFFYFLRKKLLRYVKQFFSKEIIEVCETFFYFIIIYNIWVIFLVEFIIIFIQLIR
jgi:hypothetical protein